MEINDLDQETQDLDWFALDREGAIGHFTTGGAGFLPRSVAASAEDLRAVTRYFHHTAPILGHPIVHPQARHRVRLFPSSDQDAEAACTTYLRDYAAAASRGLYSFDSEQTGQRPTGYFRVASPSRPLVAEALPREIRDILERTVLAGVAFGICDALGIDAMG
jgi:hypothetical protein